MRSALDADGLEYRLFFALWPDEEVVLRLQDVMTGLHGYAAARWVRPENLHVTLSFLGAVAEARIPALFALDFHELPEFRLVFDALRFLRRRRMLWIVPSADNPPLRQLVASLEQKLDALEQFRDQRPFCAHLTLARNVLGDFSSAGPIAPIRWGGCGIDLVASERGRSGGGYRRLRHWTLRTTPKGTSVE